MDNISHPELTFSVVALDPPPLAWDRQIDGVKRIELRTPSYWWAQHHLSNKKGQETIKPALRIWLSGLPLPESLPSTR